MLVVKPRRSVALQSTQPWKDNNLARDVVQPRKPVVLQSPQPWKDNNLARDVVQPRKPVVLQSPPPWKDNNLSREVWEAILARRRLQEPDDRAPIQDQDVLARMYTSWMHEWLRDSLTDWEKRDLCRERAASSLRTSIRCTVARTWSWLCGGLALLAIERGRRPPTAISTVLRGTSRGTLRSVAVTRSVTS